jgi:fumarate reductase subunit C
MRLFIWQRATALLLLPMILVHVAVIFYATRKGLSASEILERTRGSVVWGVYYFVFVLAAAVHGSIGVRNILAEWVPGLARLSGGLSAVLGAVLVVLGLRAVAALVVP